MAHKNQMERIELRCVEENVHVEARRVLHLVHEAMAEMVAGNRSMAGAFLVKVHNSSLFWFTSGSHTLAAREIVRCVLDNDTEGIVKAVAEEKKLVTADYKKQRKLHKW